MAVSGLIMIAFLLFHMYGNLKMFVGFEAFDHYAHWLKGATEDGGMLYPINMQGQFIWIFRVVMLLAVVLHIWSAYSLSRLSLAVRLGIETAEDADTLDALGDTDPRGYTYRVYEWLGYLTEGLLSHA